MTLLFQVPTASDSVCTGRDKEYYRDTYNVNALSRVGTATFAQRHGRQGALGEEKG